MRRQRTRFFRFPEPQSNHSTIRQSKPVEFRERKIKKYYFIIFGNLIFDTVILAPEVNEMHYGARMKEWITDHDIKQKTLAKEFHVTEAMMSHYMTGRNEITVDVLVKFARKYGLSMDYLVGLTETREPPLNLTEEERQLVLGYRASSRDQKEMLLRAVSGEQKSGR